MNPGKATAQYLQRYAEPVAPLLTSLANALPSIWQQALVIPACREGDEFIRRLLDCVMPVPTLVIVVLNGPAQMAQAERDSTLQPLACLSASTSLRWQDDDGFLYLFEHQRQGFLCVNLLQAPAGWPTQAGVGYARKLGTDIALWLQVQGRLLSPWVRSSDADVHWPEDYFAPLQPSSAASAVLYPFEHGAVQEQDADASEAAWLYDAWLRYYVAGLRWSGSPWAFHTIGSTLAIHLDHYAMQRGFPRREAGEDFYLLNKLAKSGRIERLSQPQLRLSHRVSDRTPFGTGHGIGRIAADGNRWPFYHPDSFRQLALWHEWLPRLWQADAREQAPWQAPVLTVLHDLGLADILHHCQRQCRSADAFTRHLWHWFDAAQTRKCIHLLRDRFHGSVDFPALLQAVRSGSVPFITQPDIDSAQTLSRYLQQQETHP